MARAVSQEGSCGSLHRKIMISLTSSFSFFLFFFPPLFLLMATLVAYGSSQVRGLIGAAAADLHRSHSHAGSKPHLRLTPQLAAMLDP